MMKELLTEWKQFINEERLLDLSKGNHINMKRLNSALKTNPNLKKVIVDAYIKKIIVPRYKNLDPTVKEKFNHMIKNPIELEDSQKLTTIRYKMTGAYILGEKAFKSILKYIIRKHSTYLSGIDNASLLEILYNLTEDTNFNIDIPVLSRASSDVVKNNLKWLESYDFSIKDLNKISMLSHLMIDSYLGSGAFGKVYGFKDVNRAIKIFSSGVNMVKDIKRYEQVESELFSGKGVITDMPYFENGKIGDSGYHYVIMPKIIQIEKSEWFQKHPHYYDTVCDAAKYVAERRNGLGYREFLDEVQSFVRHARRTPLGMEQLKEVIPYVDKIIKAAYQGYSKFSGEDFHGGNIGFLEQRPDILFYFDM